MASQVFSGTSQSSFTYANNTGQNVRVVINYLSVNIGTSSSASIGISAGNLRLTFSGSFTVGRNLAFSTYLTDQISSAGSMFSNVLVANNAYAERDRFSSFSRLTEVTGFPTELMLSSGQVFTISGNTNTVVISYNIVIIPEAG